MTKAAFNGSEPFFLGDQLSEDKRAIRDAERDFAEGEFAPLGASGIQIEHHALLLGSAIAELQAFF